MGSWPPKKTAGRGPIVNSQMEGTAGGTSTIITVLRNAAQNSLKYKTELALVKEQHIDITNFENELNEF